MPIEVAIPAKLYPLFEPRRYKVLHGGRGGGKSQTVARVLLAMAAKQRLRILCSREVQKSLRDSVHKLLSDLIGEMKLDVASPETGGFSYDVQNAQIIGSNGSEFIFSGLQEHTAASIKSFEGIDICWVEEAHSVSEASWDILVPTIRKPNAEIWITFNPTLETDEVYQRFVLGNDDDAWVCEINWRDNPWFPKTLDDERLKMKFRNPDKYEHIWEGKCQSAAGVIFKREWFKYYDRVPDGCRFYLSTDYAVSIGENDWTEIGVFAIDSDRNIYAVDWWSGQTAPDAWADMLGTLGKRWKVQSLFEEKGPILRSVDGYIKEAMRRNDTWMQRHQLASATKKAVRAMGFAGRASNGTVFLPKNKPWVSRLVNQLCAFTGEDGRVDDMVDVCSLLGRGLDKMHAGNGPVATAKKAAYSPFSMAKYDEGIKRMGLGLAEPKARFF